MYFYSTLNIENATDYRHAKNVCKEFNNKNLGDYHNWYVQSDMLLYADISENFRDNFIEIYEPDSAHFLSAPRLAW